MIAAGMKLRFGVVTDVHFGPVAHKDGKLRKLSHRAPSLLGEVVERMNREHRPDFVVNLGDVLEDESLDADRRAYREFLDVLSALEAPVVHVAGNHDTVHLTPDELAALWGRTTPLHYVQDVDGVRFAVLHTRETKDVDVRLDAAQLAWIERELDVAPGPVIVLMHHPASEQRLEGNRWFERAPHICRVAERRELRRVLQARGNVLAVLNGHVHWNHFDVIHGIGYVTLQSLVENLDDDAPGRPARAYAVVDVDDRRVTVTVHGEEAARYQIERPR